MQRSSKSSSHVAEAEEPYCFTNIINNLSLNWTSREDPVQNCVIWRCSSVKVHIQVSTKQVIKPVS